MTGITVVDTEEREQAQRLLTPSTQIEEMKEKLRNDRTLSSD